MNWMSLIVQFVSLRKSMQESRALIEAAQAMAERGKRFLMGFLGIFFAAIFFFSALLVAVIELGLQIDRDGHLSYSGLMVSATILFAFGLTLTLLSLFVGLSQPGPQRPAEPPHSAREDRIKDLIEEFLVVFLTQMAKGSQAGGAEAPRPEAKRAAGTAGSGE